MLELAVFWLITSLLLPAQQPYVEPMSNGIPTPAAVSLFEKQSRLVFQRMGRQITKLIKSANADNVHKFRTHSRRVEALVSELSPQNGNQKKLLKLLSRLRKKAGKVRDLDVQIAFLKQLKVPDRQRHRAQLLEWLDSEQLRRKKKFEKTMDDKTLASCPKRNQARRDRSRDRSPEDGPYAAA
jgi:CHAD domain-containing protein